MKIERVTHASEELVVAFARLLPQLNPRTRIPGHDDLSLVVASPDTHLLVARDPDVVGTLTLTLFRLPTGLRARINAVVVDADARGRGVGEALTREAIRIARGAGAQRLSLSAPGEREAANRLYGRTGFERVVTNSYELTL